MDQMVTHFSCKRATRRWTLAFFFNMLDVMALAAFSVCKDIENFTKPDSRRQFLVSLSNSLVNANIENRMNKARTMGQFSVRTAIECYFGRKLWVSNNITCSIEIRFFWLSLVFISIQILYFIGFRSFFILFQIDAPLLHMEAGPTTLEKKKLCKLCYDGQKDKRKTRFFCVKCSNPVCQQHSKVEYTYMFHVQEPTRTVLMNEFHKQ